MSYSNSFPTQKTTLNLDFANSGKLDSRLSYTRSSSGTYMSSEKALSSENLIDNSNSYNSGGWSEARVDQTIGQTDPTGGTSAKLIDQTSGQTTAGVAYYTGTFGSEELTFSIFLKPNGRTKPNLAENLTDSSNTVKRTYFDLTGAGAVGTKDAAHTASIAKLGDWYRCTITFTPHAADSGSVYLYISDTDNSQTVADDGNGYTVYGANLSTTGQLVTNETSGSIHREYAPLLKTASADAPRFEYAADGQSVGSGTAKGLLVESQATNKATYSEDFTNATYNKYRATIESAAAIAPDGTLTASLLREDATASNTHYLQAVTATGLSVGATKYAVSIFVKSAGRSKIKIYDNNQNTSGSTTFDLSSGTVVTGDGSIKSCSNGWYRCTIIPTANYSATSSVYIQMDNGSGTSYTGDNFSGILVWGYQLETGVSASSSYIKSNSGSSTTRSADSCSVADFGYTGGPVSITTEVTAAAAADGTQRIFTLFENSDLLSTYFSGGGDIKTFVDVGGSTQVDASILADAVSGTAYKVGISFDTNDYRGVSNGTLGNADTSCTLPDYSSPTLQIGAQSGGSNPLSGHIKRVALYNVALSDTELQALTS